VTAPSPSKPLIGRRERVDLPEWGIRGLRAKVDTGARTSAIHVEDIEYLDAAGAVLAAAPTPNGRTPAPDEAVRARFDVILHRRASDRRVTIEADLVRTSVVRPSHGKAQQRPVVETTLRLGPVARRIQVSLVCRKHMLCRMLLGRTALEGFLVDASRKYVLVGGPGGRREGRRKEAT